MVYSHFLWYSLVGDHMKENMQFKSNRNLKKIPGRLFLPGIRHVQNNYPWSFTCTDLVLLLVKFFYYRYFLITLLVARNSKKLRKTASFLLFLFVSLSQNLAIVFFVRIWYHEYIKPTGDVMDESTEVLFEAGCYMLEHRCCRSLGEEAAGGQRLFRLWVWLPCVSLTASSRLLCRTIITTMSLSSCSKCLTWRQSVMWQKPWNSSVTLAGCESSGCCVIVRNVSSISPQQPICPVRRCRIICSYSKKPVWLSHAEAARKSTTVPPIHLLPINSTTQSRRFPWFPASNKPSTPCRSPTRLDFLPVPYEPVVFLYQSYTVCVESNEKQTGYLTLRQTIRSVIWHWCQPMPLYTITKGQPVKCRARNSIGSHGQRSYHYSARCLSSS